jgi:hypothetical protein
MYVYDTIISGDKTTPRRKGLGRHVKTGLDICIFKQITYPPFGPDGHCSKTVVMEPRKFEYTLEHGSLYSENLCKRGGQGSNLAAEHRRN